MLAIKNNLMAETAARALGKSYDSLAVSVERLSSGLRINSAKDDAAGLAVRELIRADIAILRQGSRNAQDAISMAQTAEGAMSVVDEILVRMSELAEQAATESYSQDQRLIMNQEFDQLANEITRIAVSTKFNNMTLLNSSASYDIVVGDTTNKITINAQQMTRTALELDSAISAATTATLVNRVGVMCTSDQYIDASHDKVEWSYKFSGGSSAIVTFTSGSAYTLAATVAQINDAYSAVVTSGQAAAAYYDSDTGAYYLKITASAAGLLGSISFSYSASAGDITHFDSTSATGNKDWTFADGTDSAGVAITIRSVASAAAALAQITSAINVKDTYRAHLGYIMNRLGAARSVVDIQAENLLAAESRISDVDVATEMAAMTRNQVLAQAGIAMLAQANTMPQMALQLLA
jgi:flagellin